MALIDIWELCKYQDSTLSVLSFSLPLASAKLCCCCKCISISASQQPRQPEFGKSADLVFVCVCVYKSMNSIERPMHKSIYEYDVRVVCPSHTYNNGNTHSSMWSDWNWFDWLAIQFCSYYARAHSQRAHVCVPHTKSVDPDEKLRFSCDFWYMRWVLCYNIRMIVDAQCS